MRVNPADLLLRDEAQARDTDLLEYMEQSLQVFGQLVPIIVNADDVVLDGVTRLLAIRNLGLPVALVVRLLATDDEADIHIRLHANRLRSEMTPLEAYDLFKRLKLVQAAKGIANKSANGGDRVSSLAQTGVPNLGTPVEEPVGDSAKAASAELPFGHETMRKIEVLERYAVDESAPELLRETATKGLEQIRRTNRVHPAYSKLIEVRDAMPEARKARVDGYDDAMYQMAVLRAVTKAEAVLDIDPERAAGVLSRFGVLDGYRAPVEQIARWCDSFLQAGDTR